MWPMDVKLPILHVETIQMFQVLWRKKIKLFLKSILKKNKPTKNEFANKNAQQRYNFYNFFINA